MFEVGSLAIDTKKKQSVEIMHVLQDYVTLYIVRGSDDEYYITDPDSLENYDKHYFDEE